MNVRDLRLEKKIRHSLKFLNKWKLKYVGQAYYRYLVVALEVASYTVAQMALVHFCAAIDADDDELTAAVAVDDNCYYYSNVCLDAMP